MIDRIGSNLGYTDKISEQRRKIAEEKRNTFDGAGLSARTKLANNLITGEEYDLESAKEMANQPHAVFIAGPWIVTAEDVTAKVDGIKTKLSGIVDAFGSVSGRFGFPVDVFIANKLNSADSEKQSEIIK